MSYLRKMKEREKRRTMRVRSRLKKHSEMPRVSVFRSLKHIYAQVIDDAGQKTIASCSSLELKDIDGDKKSLAYAVGKELASRAKQEGITKVIFDRGKYRYHGRVEQIARGLRDADITV